jgi:hypothetical protein
VTHSREGVDTICGLDGRNSSVGIETRESLVGFLAKAKDFSVDGLYLPGYDAVLTNDISEKLTAKTFRV